MKNVEDEENFKANISKEDIIEEYIQSEGSVPTWKDKKQKDMDKDEKNEYQKYRKVFEKKNEEEEEVIPEEVKSEEQEKETEEVDEPETEEVSEHEEEDVSEKKIDEHETMVVEEEPEKKTKKKVNKKVKKVKKEHPKEFYEKSENNVSQEEKTRLLISTGTKARRDMLTDEQKAELDKAEKENKFIEDYCEHHKIDTQDKLNYAIEHDEKFKLFLDKTNKLGSLYTGNHLEDIEKEKKMVIEQLEKDAEKDKKRKISKKFGKKKKLSNVFEKSKKELDLTPYKNKKLESQGSILTMYLRKNGLAQLRYVKMDEVGQIKVDGYVYHERDAVYRFGKKNDPVLIIMEGALVPINKETLKEHLGCEAAEAQKLIIKGIEQAEVVKSSGIDENANKPFAPPKWMVIAGIAIAIGLYVFLGGSG